MNLRKEFCELCEPTVVVGLMMLLVPIVIVVGDILLHFSDLMLYSLAALLMVLGLVMAILQSREPRNDRTKDTIFCPTNYQPMSKGLLQSGQKAYRKAKMMQNCSVCHKKTGKNKIINIDEGMASSLRLLFI